MNDHILDSWQHTSKLSKLVLPFSGAVLLTSCIAIILIFMYAVSYYRPLKNQNPDAKVIKESAMFVKHVGARITFSKIQIGFMVVQLVAIFGWSFWHLHTGGLKSIDNSPVKLILAGVFAINLPYYIMNCIYDARRHYTKSDLIFDHHHEINLISFSDIKWAKPISIIISSVVFVSLLVTVIMTPYSDYVYRYDNGTQVITMFKNHRVQPDYRYTADIQTKHKHGVWKESLKHSKCPLYIQDHFSVSDLKKGNRLYH